MKKICIAFLAAILVVCLASCNPECSTSGSITLSTDFNQPGFEVLIKAIPLSSLKNKKVFFGKTEAKTRFIDTLGLIFTVPEGVSGKTSMRLEDNDCVEHLDFDVKNKDFFTNNPNYVFPITPQIIIPTFATTFPTNIDRAWLSPINTSYCVWFGTSKGKTNLVEGGNLELCMNCTPACGSKTNLYNTNRMYGVYDTITHTIHFWIDRTSKGISQQEEFEARFIDPSKTIYSEPKYTIDCAVTSPKDKKNFMLLLTSKTTGRQTVVFQGNE